MMNYIPYTEIDGAEDTDIGKTCLMYLGGRTIAIEDTLDECIETARGIGIDVDRDEIDDHTDLLYLVAGDLIAVVVDVAPTED